MQYYILSLLICYLLKLIFNLSLFTTFIFFLIIPRILLSLSDNNFYQLIMIFGKKGSGKSTYIAKKSQYYIKKGYKVYTNFPVSGCHLYDPTNIGVNTFEPDSVVFCDEVALIWHNRDWKSFNKCLIEWFKFQRKYRIRMYLFSQTWDDNEKSLRIMTDKLYLVNRIGKFSIVRPIVKNMGIATDSNGNGAIVDTYKYGSIFDYEFTYLPRYYGLFTSFDAPDLKLINDTYQDYDELARIYSDTKKWILYQIKSKIKKSKLYEKVIKLFIKN